MRTTRVAQVSGRRGSALLAVLWVSAALAAIAFSLSNTVLGETQRTSTDVDGLRSYYLAVSGLQRAEYELLWAAQSPDQFKIRRESGRVDYTFPSGDVRVEIIPEAAKLNVNEAPPEELYKLMTAIGIEPDRAGQLVAAILDWRGGQAGSAFDQYYASLTPSFRARHASFEEIEELLSVKGITPELFYGTYVPSTDEAGGSRLTPRIGLVDCLSIFGSKDRIDANSAAAPVLAAIGLSPDAINALLERRRAKPLTEPELGSFAAAAGNGAGRLRVGGNSILTLRATARLRLVTGQFSDLRRTVAAQIKYMPEGAEVPIHILRWYDTAWSY
jgi:general secretion pathway protein K